MAAAKRLTVIKRTPTIVLDMVKKSKKLLTIYCADEYHTQQNDTRARQCGVQ